MSAILRCSDDEGIEEVLRALGNRLGRMVGGNTRRKVWLSAVLELVVTYGQDALAQISAIVWL